MGAALTASVSLISCGGGGDESVTGGGGAPPAAGPTGSVSGTVGGTTVIAVDASGNIVGNQFTSPPPPAAGPFPFTLAGIPVGQPIRLFLITSGNIFPLVSNGNNAFALSNPGTVDLGFIEVLNDPLAGPQAIPANPPPNLSTVNPGAIPAALLSPPTGGLSLAALVQRGLDALRDGAFLTAKSYFAAAANLGGTGGDADAAKFFLAFTRVAGLGLDLFSDGNASNFDKIGDLLDSAGCVTADVRRTSWQTVNCPMFSSTFPSGGGRLFLGTAARSELEQALLNLSGVSSAFNRQWIEPSDKSQVESDFGDVLFFRAIIEAALGSIDLQGAYNAPDTIDQTQHKRIDQILATHPALLTLTNTNTLNSARAHFDNALAALQQAVTVMHTETDSQLDDFVSLVDMTPRELAGLDANLAGLRAGLNGPGTVEGTTYNFSGLFAPGVSLRPLLPPVDGNDFIGFFPDPTLSGVIVSGTTDLNRDSNGNGRADVLE